MPFDPSKPADHSPLVSAEMRGQLNGLKALVDAVPGITSAAVDGVNTGFPGDPATVSVSVAGNVLHLSFTIPRGNDGLQGQPGPQGPPFASATVDSTGTLNPGENATVSVFFDGNTVHFSFGIPRGASGADGLPGAPGEVSNAALAGAISNAITGTSNNSDAVATLGAPFTSDPPTLADMETLRAKINELIGALRR